MNKEPVKIESELIWWLKVLVFVAVGGLIVYGFWNLAGKDILAEIIKNSTNNTPAIVNEAASEEYPYKLGAFSFKEHEFDFGVIKQSGGTVRHGFFFRYDGEEKVKITGVPTSCSCTSAIISDTEFTKGEEGAVIVEFDPNLHAEPEGKFNKTISILTEPTLSEIPEIKIWAQIDLDLGPEAFKLKEHLD